MSVKLPSYKVIRRSTNERRRRGDGKHQGKDRFNFYSFDFKFKRIEQFGMAITVLVHAMCSSATTCHDAFAGRPPFSITFSKYSCLASCNDDMPKAPSPSPPRTCHPSSSSASAGYTRARPLLNPHLLLPPRKRARHFVFILVFIQHVWIICSHF